MTEIVTREILISSNIVEEYANISTDRNPIHLDHAFAATTVFGRRIAHGMLIASFFSALIATDLPGPGSIYLGQSLKFILPVFIGDTVKVEISIKDIRADKPIYTLNTRAYVNENLVLDGEATVLKKILWS